MFNIKHFTLVNIIPNKEVIQELVGQRFTQTNIEHELRRLINDTHYREQMINEYHTIQYILGSESAPQNAAKIIHNTHI